MFFAPILIFVIHSLIFVFKPTRKLTIVSKTGRKVELDFRKHDADAMIAFLDVLLEEK